MPRKKSPDAERHPISKSVRFEVFKRDGFACVYCGKTPPDVVLEIDHIEPVYNGGTNDINNLVTACFDCNRGKGHVGLEIIPSKLVDNLEVLKAQKEQMKEYNKHVTALEKELQKSMNIIARMYTSYFPEYTFSDNFRNVSLKGFVKALPLNEVAEAIEIACTKTKHSEGSIKYFCGICWKKIRNKEAGNH